MIVGLLLVLVLLQVLQTTAVAAIYFNVRWNMVEHEDFLHEEFSRLRGQK